MAKYRGPKFYAVRVGRKTGVFNTWEECQEQTSGFSGARFKSFLSRDEALAWINEGQCSGLPRDDGSEDSDDNSTDTEAWLRSTPGGTQQCEQKSSQPGLGLSRQATLGNFASRESSSGPSRPMTFSQIMKQQQQQQQSQQSQQNEPESTSSSTSSIMKHEEPSSVLTWSNAPLASQSYFERFPGFVPDASARFDDEFGRLASSQGLVPGSREFRRERTQALKSELLFHYSQPEEEKPAPSPPSPSPSSPPPVFALSLFRIPSSTPAPPPRNPNPAPEPTPELFTPAQRLATYRSMCAAIGLEPGATVAGCVRQLRGVLVNIVDFVDAKRAGGPVKVWDARDFAAFSAYTLQDEHRFDKEEAKAHGGFLAKLLRRLDPRGGGGGGGAGTGMRRPRGGKGKRKNKNKSKKRGLETTDGGGGEQQDRPVKRACVRAS
ncbi:Caulimovirus viroplasmin-domain-containing protein [Biscogniauxia mediterranea]|nr:Caulimovirus viroplasmin-domain-containing protein [Biscogniauxia mediterranea]